MASGNLRTLNKRRDAAHGFRMAQAEITARIQCVIEGFRRRLARCVIEIDQQIAAEDHVKVAVGERVGRLGRLTRVNSTACRRSSQIWYSSATSLEILFQPEAREDAAPNGPNSVRHARGEDAGIDVGGDDLHIPLVDVPASVPADTWRWNRAPRPRRRDAPDADWIRRRSLRWTISGRMESTRHWNWYSSRRK